MLSVAALPGAELLLSSERTPGRDAELASFSPHATRPDGDGFEHLPAARYARHVLPAQRRTDASAGMPPRVSRSNSRRKRCSPAWRSCSRPAASCAASCTSPPTRRRRSPWSAPSTRAATRCSAVAASPTAASCCADCPRGASRSTPAAAAGSRRSASPSPCARTARPRWSSNWCSARACIPRSTLRRGRSSARSRRARHRDDEYEAWTSRILLRRCGLRSPPGHARSRSRLGRLARQRERAPRRGTTRASRSPAAAK